MISVNALALRRRLSWLEIPLLAVALYLFYLVTDRKDIGYAVGVLAGIGIAALAFFRPRWGLLISLILLFSISVLSTMMTLATTAQEHGLTGLPFPMQTAWFLWGVQIIYVVLLLSYLCTERMKKGKLEPLSALEWILLLPVCVSISYFPISMSYGNELMDFWYDATPLLFYAGIVIIARVLGSEGNARRERYFFLDWFVVLNFLILIPIWYYNFKYNPFRSGDVGITAIRFGTGPYDFNFFLVPLLGMILVYDDKLGVNRRRLYQFAFFFSLIRVVVSLFRGAIAGTFLAIIITIFLVDASRRWRWVRTLLTFILAVTLVFLVLVSTVPAARATFNIALVKRVQALMTKGTAGASIRFRLFEMQKALEDMERQPILGYAPGSRMVKHFRATEFAKEELFLHSAYMWFWYKMGVLGLAVLATFFIGIYTSCIMLLRRTVHPPDRAWVIGTLAATIAMLPVIHTNNMLVRVQGASALLLLLFGLCLIVTRYRGIPRTQLPPAEETVKA